jgi:2-polyprenyl-3-methyl-5-hydroxy-6-metoxy-1,4-benzoquinol methylase
VAIDVLEHVFCPRTFLAEARRLLTPGGLLLIETPNMDGWTPRLLGSRHPRFRPPEHLTYFTPPTIRRLLEQTGFRIEQLQHSAQKALTLEYVLGLTGATNPLVTGLVKACVGRFASLRQRSFTVPLDLLLAVAAA